MSNKGRPIRKPVSLSVDPDDEEDDVLSLPQPKKDVPQFRKRKKIPIKPTGDEPSSQIEKPKPSVKPVSFLDEDEEDTADVFTIRKAKESRRAEKEKKMAKFKSLMAPRESEPAPSSYLSSTADEYSQERLRQMRNELSVRLVQAPAPEDLEEMMFASEMAATKPRKDEVEPMVTEDDLEGAIIINSDEEFGDSLIPTQDRINEIRRKRDKFRQLGYTQDDFISLKSEQDTDRMLLGGKIDDEPEYDTYGDTAANRRTFGDPSKLAAQQREQQRMMMQEMEEDEDDEDTKEWQESLLSKVGIKTARNKTVVIDDFDAIGRKPVLLDMEEEIKSHDPLEFKPETLDNIIQRLKDKVRMIDNSHAFHTQQLEGMEAKIKESRKKKESFEGAEEDFEDEVAFFRDLRDFSYDLMDCLNEKSKDLNYLAGDIEEKANNTATSVLKQRQLHIQDELEEVRAIMNNSIITETTEKENRRKERLGHRRRKQENQHGPREEPEGWSSDDSEYVTHAYDNYQQEREDILHSVRGLFDDAHEDFASLPPIATHFEKWKKKYPESYKKAYGAESFKKISETYVLQEFLARWDALNFSPIKYEDFEWFEILSDFLLWEKEEDNDCLLVPHAVSFTLDRVKPIFIHYYNPFSTSQTNSAISIVREIQEYATPKVPSVEQKLQEIEVAITLTLQGAVDILVVLYPPPEKNVGAVQEFCKRQFWSGIKLLFNCMKWSGILPAHTLEQSCIGILLNNKLIPYLRKIAVTNVQEIFQACTKISDALEPFMNYHKTPPRSLTLFRDFVYIFAESQVNTKKLTSQEKSKLLKIFFTLKDNDSCDKLSTMIGLEH